VFNQPAETRKNDMVCYKTGLEAKDLTDAPEAIKNE